MQSDLKINKSKIIYLNKTVLLRERKRHTTRHVASTPYATPDKVGTPHPRWVPPLAKVGTPGQGRCPPW